MKKLINIIDFHSHILPGADHGSSSVETSIFQLDQAYSHGITRVIATPHFYPHKHTVKAFLERRNAAYEKLMAEYHGEVEIRLGAEVMLCDGLENLAVLDQLFIHGTKTLLLELPYDVFKDEYCDSVKKMVEQGIDVVLAHADRYPKKNIEKMLKCGARAQLNASSLCKLFIRRELYKWIKDKNVIALGSDIHGKSKKAYDNFTRAVNKIAENVEYIKAESDSVWDKSTEFVLS